MYKVISSSSKGNSVLYHNSIMVDIGIPYTLLKPYFYRVQLILLTHNHPDHINLSSLKKFAFERPGLRIGCCEWMLKYINGIVKPKNIDIYKIGEYYNYNNFTISPIKLYHDIENCGYRIITDNYKILHATDTAHLEGITAKNYDLFGIEFNYNEETIHDIINKKQSKGEFAYEKGAINSHLSEQQASDFFYKNRNKNSKLLRLHE